MGVFLQNIVGLPHNLFSYREEYAEVQVHSVCSHTWLSEGKSSTTCKTAVTALTLTACFWEGTGNLRTQRLNLSIALCCVLEKRVSIS